MVYGEVLGHSIVEVPPSLAFIGRHDVVGLADLAGDVILGPGEGVAGAVQTTLAGATRREDTARQVQPHQLVPDLDSPTRLFKD